MIMPVFAGHGSHHSGKTEGIQLSVPRSDVDHAISRRWGRVNAAPGPSRPQRKAECGRAGALAVSGRIEGVEVSIARTDKDHPFAPPGEEVTGAEVVIPVQFKAPVAALKA